MIHICAFTLAIQYPLEIVRIATHNKQIIVFKCVNGKRNNIKWIANRVLFFFFMFLLGQFRETGKNRIIKHEWLCLNQLQWLFFFFYFVLEIESWLPEVKDENKRHLKWKWKSGKTCELVAHGERMRIVLIVLFVSSRHNSSEEEIKEEKITFRITFDSFSCSIQVCTLSQISTSMSILSTFSFRISSIRDLRLEIIGSVYN